MLNSIASNWTVSSVMKISSGAPVWLYGANHMFYDYAEGGVTLTGVTISHLHKAAKVTRVPRTTDAALLDPKYLGAADGMGAANSELHQPE